jgi:hypothetical protein
MNDRNILKVDEYERIVGGVVYCLGNENYVDAQGDFIDSIEELRAAAKSWMIEARATMKVMHEGRPVDTPVVECFVADEDTAHWGSQLHKGDWWIAAHIPPEHDDLWQAVLNGDITGFSMAGTAQSEEVDKVDGDGYVDVGEDDLIRLVVEAAVPTNR